MYFDAVRKSGFFGDDVRLTYDEVPSSSSQSPNLSGTNISDMDLRSGIFTAPKAGVYYFSFHGTKRKGMMCILCLMHNGGIVAHASDNYRDGEGVVSLSKLLTLSRGDTVEVSVSGGWQVNYNNDIHFQGFQIIQH